MGVINAKPRPRLSERPRRQGKHECTHWPWVRRSVTACGSGGIEGYVADQMSCEDKGDVFSVASAFLVCFMTRSLAGTDTAAPVRSL